MNCAPILVVLAVVTETVADREALMHLDVVKAAVVVEAAILSNE